jgi:hypothetical protein
MKQFAAGLPDFQTPNRNLGKFWKALEWKKLVHFMAIWNILRPFGIIYGCLLLSVVIWYIFPNLVCLDQEKSGNPGLVPRNEDSFQCTKLCTYSEPILLIYNYNASVAVG